jgi:hypothetical protein
MRLNPKSFLAGSAALALVSLGACVPAPEPTPAPAPAPPAPAPRPTPAPAPPPFAGNWMDAPLTPGDWRYAGGTATFAGPEGSVLLTMRCTGGAVVIDRAGVATGAPSFVVRSETVSRSLNATNAGGSTSASLPAQDSLLDAIAFSKGRFAVENAGLPTLYIPSYPEVTRVIEDCR